MTGGRFAFRLRERARWVDADAFGLLGAFRRAAGAAGWSKAEVDAVLVEAVRADFAHLFRTLAWHVVDPDGRWPGDLAWLDSVTSDAKCAGTARRVRKPGETRSRRSGR
ncbi:MAG: hypothetical protein U0871_01085 [Gemmataceae bacterium]